jgi:hypothetical protein
MCVQARHFEAGEYLAREGDRADEIFYIETGEVEICFSRRENVDEDLLDDAVCLLPAHYPRPFEVAWKPGTAVLSYQQGQATPTRTYASEPHFVSLECRRAMQRGDEQLQQSTHADLHAQEVSDSDDGEENPRRPRHPRSMLRTMYRAALRAAATMSSTQ